MPSPTSQRVFNFSAGPAAPPEPVLEEAQRSLLCLPGAGASILEISHRSATFREILNDCESRLRKLLSIPDEYRVLFLQGGSRLQFSMVPMNLLTEHQPSADYILTGSWGKHALKQAELEGTVRIAWDGASTDYTQLPEDSELDLDPGAAYVHFTSNETIQGVQFAHEPDTGTVPLVCDASSDFLSRPLDLARYGLIYACAQKNAGPAGVTIVILRDDLLPRSREAMSGMLSYRNQADHGSLYNTAPTFCIYMVGLVAKWLIDEVGGLDQMQRDNREKAELLYNVLDQSHGFYRGHAAPQCRSHMNVTFRLPSDELNEQFVTQAQQQGLHSLKGHRSVGGIRASIYNAMPHQGVVTLRDFMIDFQTKHA